MLATQLIKAWARQRGYIQAYIIRLSINEDPKLEKGKKKKGSVIWSFMQSLSHVSLCDCVYYNVYHNLPFSTSAIIYAMKYPHLVNLSTITSIMLYICPITRSFDFSNFTIKSYNITSYSLLSVSTGCSSLYSLYLLNLFL